ncbi:MAG: dockerin type I repeat-containing protein [Candidatus Zixiibacteriota bacterium]
MKKKLILALVVAFLIISNTTTMLGEEFEHRVSQSLPDGKSSNNQLLTPASFAYSIENKSRIYWSPQAFTYQPIHVPLNSIDTVFITIENMGTDTLYIYSISSGASWLTIDPTLAVFPPGCCPLQVKLIITGGSEEAFWVDSVRIQSNDQAGNDDIYVPMHVIVSDLYQEVEFSEVGNPTYYLGVSNTGNLANTNDTLGFYLHQDPNQPNFLYDGSPIMGFINPDYDSLVGRYIFDDEFLVPATELSVDTFPQLKTIVVKKEFWPVRIQIPPADQYWPWWKIKEKLYIFYSEEGKPESGRDNKNEQYIALEVLTVFYDEPPDWWVEVTPPDSIPETYLGMALDIDCISDSGAWNYPGNYDEPRRMTSIQGYGETNEKYRMAIAQKDPCYDTLSGEGQITYCWRDNHNPAFEKEPVYAMHILRNDSVVYPAGGYVDEELYRWMSTPGHILQGDGSPTDYNIVTTGKVIPAQSFPPSDTYSVAYVLVVSDEENIEKLNDCVDMVKCGNVNRDGQVTIADVVYFINYLFRGGPEIWRYMGDDNGDGVSSITDCVSLLGYLLKGGPPPTCSSL